MPTILKLLKLQIDNKTDAFKTRSIKKMSISIFKRVLILIALFLVIGYGVLRLTTLGFKINAEFLGIVLLVLQVVSLVFGVGSIISNLYLSKDNELLMGLPATPNQLFLSKILLIYFQELSINATLSIPLFLALGVFGGMGLEFYLCIPIFIFILPLLPLVIASFISLPVMIVIKFLKKHMLLSIILLLAAVALVLTLYIDLVGNIAGNFDIASKQIETVRKINAVVLDIGKYIILYYQLASAMIRFEMWGWIFIYFVSCQFILLLTILIIRPFYFKTAMSNSENTFKVKTK